ncbi:MAG: phytanoyl-CoA dioxygenase family protein [Proteobacteria bacterium]|nr:phytanoyl-CoA dioxygenase family protein [Pseudomonadota bacterium]
MLSETQVEHYRSQGYVIPDYRVPDDLLAQIRSHHADLLKAHPEFNDYCPALLAFDTWFVGVAREPALLDMVGQLIGEDIALWNSSFFAKPAKTGKRTPWHQDGEYWPIRPLATCSVWIAVDASTPANGALRVLPGSHRSGALEEHRHNADAGLSLPLEMVQVDEDRAVDLVLEPGQISMHDVFLAHASEPNHSDNPRRGMTLRYMPTSSIYRRDLAREGNGVLAMKERTLYLMRGIDVCGKNDFLLRS